MAAPVTIRGLSPRALSRPRRPQEELRAFLVDRLTEEADAAATRMARGQRRRTSARGLEHVQGLVRDLRQGHLPDRISLLLLLGVYAGHPDFRGSWCALLSHTTESDGVFP